jgi:hypothetical protein
MRIWERALLGIAMLWGLALPILALVVPAYSGESAEMSGDGTIVTRNSTTTMVQENGWQVLMTISVPFVVAVMVTVLLSLRTRHPWPLVLAFVVAGLLAVGTLLAMFSIGVFVLPVTVCLIAACAIRAAGTVPIPIAAPQYRLP